MKQPRVRYFLEKSRTGDRSKPELVMAAVSYGYTKQTNSGKRSVPFKISLECRVLPKTLGSKNNNYRYDESVVKRNSGQLGFLRTRQVLLESALHKLSSDYNMKKLMPTPEEFKEALKVELGQVSVVAEEKQSIVEALVTQIEYYWKILTSNKKDSKKTGTIKGYNTLLLHLENYEIATGRKLYFEDFDEDMYWQFWEVSDEIYRGNITVVNPRRTKKKPTDPLGFANKTVQRYQKNLLAFFRAVNKKYNIKLDLTDENLILEKSDARKSTYVKETELEIIINSDVSFDSGLQAAKNFIIVSGLTGLRYEGVVEAAKTTVETYSDDKYNFQYLYLNLGKVKNQVCIPILKPVRDVISANQGKVPMPPNNADINDFLKDLYRHLGFNTLEDYVRNTFQEGIRESKQPKCDIITAHDARRGFITNLDRQKVSKRAVLNMTHPSKGGDMHDLYNKSSLLDKAKDFVDEVESIRSQIYQM